MNLHSLLDELERFLSRPSDRDASRQVGYMRAPGGLSFFNYDRITQIYPFTASVEPAS